MVGAVAATGCWPAPMLCAHAMFNAVAVHVVRVIDPHPHP